MYGVYHDTHFFMQIILPVISCDRSSMWHSKASPGHSQKDFKILRVQRNLRRIEINRNDNGIGSHNFTGVSLISWSGRELIH